VTQDRTATGSWTPGGPSLYAARTALALGCEVTLVTGLIRDYALAVLAGLDVRSIPAGTLPRYANSYDSAGNRTQLLLHPGEPLRTFPIGTGDAFDAFILAPAYHEFTAWPPAEAPVRAISLQGVLRDTASGCRVVPTHDPIRAAEPFMATGLLAFFSDEDTPDGPSLARAIVKMGATAVLTRGYYGAVLFDQSGEHFFPAVPADAVDPTGAGDCFATAFVVRFAETRDISAAMQFALAAGALSVEGRGIAGVPTREAVEARMRKVAA
jgi:hypothetical protein